MNTKRLFIVVMLFFVCLLGFIFSKSDGRNSVTEGKTKEQKPILKQDVRRAEYARSIFIPYWQLSGQTQNLQIDKREYDRSIYFGVAGTLEGIPTDDPGYEQMDGFMRIANGSRWLTVRMTNSEVNNKVLGSRASQLKIVNDATRIAKEFGFDGLVLDFEYTSLFDTNTKRTTDFYTLFHESTKRERLKFAVTLYGDVFYRKRPYDVAEIAKNCDEVMIMAYDLHKSRGEPGPNFPLKAGKKYGYGYDSLFKDIEKLVPAEKLTIIFGMYGYDWKVDEQKRPITQASSLTTAQIQKEYIDKCDSLHCTQLIDPISAETEVNYVGEDGRYHIIWFENEESTQKKESFLKQKGIESVAYWAYGYF